MDTAGIDVAVISAGGLIEELPLSNADKEKIFHTNGEKYILQGNKMTKPMPFGNTKKLF